ncbi:MAG: methyltransferase domain-containing protein [Bacteroidales bacterium]
MSKIVKNYCEFPGFMRRPMWRIWHNFMIRFDDDVSANFMNYGYQSLNGHVPIELEEEDEPNRYGIQLYDHVVRKSKTEGKDIIEIGSGRGGGASFVTRYHKPSKYVAVDISEKIIKFCNSHYDVPGLEFVQGKAESLPLESNSFDIAVNVESSRCYTSKQAFFNEVKRVLRPGGKLLLADMIEPHEMAGYKKDIDACGLAIEEESDITKNIVKALDHDTERRKTLIDKKVPGFLRTNFYQFAGTKGSERYEAFNNGKFRYMSFVISA